MFALVLAVLPLGLGLAQAQSASVQIAVDVSQADGSVAQQVTYKRGEVLEFDQPGYTPSEIISRLQRDVEDAGINLVTASVNFTSNADKGYFDYAAGPPVSLTPSFSGSDTLLQTFSELRQSYNSSQVPAVVQLSGTPSALPSSDLDPNYVPLCNLSGNFYPLPSPGNATSLVQNAISSWIAGVNASIPGAIWIGSQEPTHTLGFPVKYENPGQTCSNIQPAELPAAKKVNIDRFVSYWTPIAQSISSRGLETGGIQPNSADTAFYAYAVQRIVAAGMPLNYLTFQDYTPSLAVTQAVNAAWKQLQSHSRYASVKVILDRFGLSLSGYNYTSAAGMVHYLTVEAQLMQYADMFYGYSIEEAGFHPTVGQSLLPPVVKWLQSAPAPLRPFTSSNAAVQGFALVQTSPETSGSIAVWKNGTSPGLDNVTLTLTDCPQALSSANVAILKGSGNTVGSYQGATIQDNSIGGLSLGPNEFFLVSF